MFCYLNLFGKSGGLLAAVRFFYVSDVQNTGDENFADGLPLQKSGGSFVRNAYAVHDGHIFFFAARYKRAFLACNVFARYAEREQSVDYAIDLRGV